MGRRLQLYNEIKMRAVQYYLYKFGKPNAVPLFLKKLHLKNFQNTMPHGGSCPSSSVLKDTFVCHEGSFQKGILSTTQYL